MDRGKLHLALVRIAAGAKTAARAARDALAPLTPNARHDEGDHQ